VVQVVWRSHVVPLIFFHPLYLVVLMVVVVLMAEPEVLAVDFGLCPCLAVDPRFPHCLVVDCRLEVQIVVAWSDQLNP
jgi:hypothetical protein